LHLLEKAVVYHADKFVTNQFPYFTVHTLPGSRGFLFVITAKKLLYLAFTNNRSMKWSFCRFITLEYICRCLDPGGS
jgi:hypothetical protein